MATTIYRSNVSALVTVSTVRVRDGRTTHYETALIVRGMVAEPIRSATKAEATVAHDRACDFAAGRVDARSVRDAHWMRAVAELAA